MQDGNEYQPDTLYDFATTIQMLLNHGNIPRNIFTDGDFHETRLALDKRMKILTKSGYCRPIRQAGIITDAMEQELWKDKILGCENPKKFQRTVYYILTKHFIMRGRGEHRDLRAGESSQIKILGMGPEKRVEYHGDFSKNPHWWAPRRKTEPKIRYNISYRLGKLSGYDCGTLYFEASSIGKSILLPP